MVGDDAAIVVAGLASLVALPTSGYRRAMISQLIIAKPRPGDRRGSSRSVARLGRHRP
jgi:hypothetical protein